MEPETKPSLVGRTSFWLHRLRQILVSFWAVWLSSLSKLRAPIQKCWDAVRPQNSTKNESTESKYEIPSVAPLKSDSPPPPNNEKKSREKFEHRLKVATFVIEVLGLIGLGIYAGLTYEMWREMQKTNANTLQAFRTDERAWVGIEPFKPKLKAPASGKFTALYTYDLYLRNSGKTVARCVEVRFPRGASGSSGDFVNHEDWIANLQDNFLLGKFKGAEGIPIIRSSPQTIAPGQVAPVPLDIYGGAPQVFPNGQENISSFVGRLDYIDEFSVRHWIKFCLFIEHGDGRLGYCKYGNDEDRSPEIPPKQEPSCPVTNPA